MPLYAYQALDVNGNKKKGTVEAENLSEAKEKLRYQGLFVSSLDQGAAIKGRQNLKGDDLVNFTMQLSQLLSGGVPLYESLLALEEQYRGDSSHRVVLSLCEQIKGGKSLSQAMESFPESFDRQYRAMVSAGESVGAIDIVLKRLTILLKKQAAIKKKIATALIYPSILGGFCLMILVLLLGFVVPSVEAVFEGRELNRFTEAVIGLSHFMTRWWWALIPLFAGGIIGCFWKLKSPEGKTWIQTQGLRLPVIKMLLIHAALARFCRTMGTLQEGGLPMIDSLRIAREVMQNAVMEEEMVRAERKILEGSNLSTELDRSAHIPVIVPRMIAVGEEAGTLAAMLNSVADMYEGELEKSIDRSMALMQPAILIFMGMIIGLILLAVLLPLTDVSAFNM